MAANKRMPNSSLYLPLTGQEQVSRLEEKFGYYLGSDDESESDCTSHQDMVSQLNLKTNKSLEWLNSQKGASTFVASSKGKQRLQQKKKRSDQHNRSECANAQQPHEKILPLSGTAIRRKESLCPDEEDDSRSRNDVSGPSTESSRQAEVTEKWKDESHFSGFCGSSLDDTERPKLAIMPSSEKVEFILSTDHLQPPVIVPATINQYLRDYQREGINFLYQHYNAKTGAILGDDMGLGKTIQVIGFLSALLGKQGNHTDTLHSIPKFIRQISDDIPHSPPKRACKPFLIIGPSAVMYNWLDELKTWGYFTASKFHGVDKENCIANLKKGKLEIVVTTFETFRDNIARLNEVEWEAVIVDEVHKIKGLKAQVTQALRTIKTPCRFGLTGTALQNNMFELWSLFDWVQPGILGTLDQFEKDFVQVIETGQRHDATKRELAQARKKKDTFSVIRKRIMLRRTKVLIADQLPSKEDLVVMCRLSEMQISVYAAILAHPDMKLVICAKDPCDCRSGRLRASCCYKYSDSGIKAWTLVFSFMHLMLKAANHMALLIPDNNTKEKQANLARSVCEIAFKDYPQFLQQTRIAAFRTLSDPKYCGKMKVLQGLLNAFHTNHDKVLIFSYSTRLLDIIEQYVISQGHEYRRIDGKVSSRRRQDIVIQFNSDKSIFLCLISTKAGSLGLNLTGANRVVIFDPNWNPSHDLQAQDRAYRIGQTQDVKVYRLVSAGTIEENIYLRQIYKQQLDEVAIGTSNARRYFHGIQGDKANHGELFGIKNMFSLRTGNSCLTMDILKRNDKLEKGLAGYDITQYVPANLTSATDCEDNFEESSDTDDRCHVDSDAEEEEDEEFLEELFGSGRSPITSRAPRNTGKSISNALLSDGYQDSVTSSSLLKKTITNMDSDSDDGEFSLIPKLHNRSQHFDCNTEKYGNPISDISISSSQVCPIGNSPLPDGEDEILQNTSSFSDITFSSRTCNTSDILFQKQSAEIRKSGAISGVSWLFSDSDDDDENDNHVLDNGVIDAHKFPVDFNSKKYRSSMFDNLVSKVTRNSIHDVRRNITHTKNVSTEKTKGVAENITKAEEKPGTSSDKVSLEQLVMKSNDVLHTHVNAQIVGSSRAEDHMTRCAMQDVFELHTNSQVPALQCDPYSEEEDVMPTNKKSNRSKNKIQEDHNTVKCVSSGSFKILVGQTPASIKRQQWSDFCKSLGMDQSTFAKTFLTADVEKRLSILRQFYSQMHPQLTEVLAQVFTLKQEALDKDQNRKRGKLSHKSKPTSSAHTKDSAACTNHIDRQSSRDPSHSSSESKLRSDIKKCRYSEASKLLNTDCLSSQSEDSSFASLQENQGFLNDKYNSFLPVPPSSSRKPRWSPKVLLYKSRTRLRKKRNANSSDKEVSFNEPGRSISVTDQYNLDDVVLDTGTSNKHFNTRTTTGNVTLIEADEDITSLLNDMGQGHSLENSQNLRAHNKTFKCHSVSDNKDCATGAMATHPVNELTVSKCVSCTNASHTNTKQDLNSSKNNIACILDDIFSLGTEKQTEKQCSPKKAEFSETSKHLSKRSNDRPDVKVSKNKQSETSCSIKVTSDCIQSETESLFDDLLRTNTLKDERMESLARFKKKSHFKGKETEAGPNSASKWEINEEKRMEIDIDDLSWCRFDTSKPSSKSEDGSASLFS